MANKTINQLTELEESPAVGDFVALWDTDAAATKKVSITNFIAAENFWQRAATTISPETDNDSVNIGTGSFIGATFDTNVAAAGVTLTATTLAADGTDADIPINITPKGTGTLVVSTAINSQADGDSVSSFGRGKIGYDGTNSDVFAIAHYDNMSSVNYALNQNATGDTSLNAKTGRIIYFRVNGTEIGRLNATGILMAAGKTIQFAKESANSLSIARSTTAATAGAALSITGAGCTSGGTDLAGGDITISSGISTGTGVSSVIIQAPTAGSTGTADNSPATVATFAGAGITFAKGIVMSGAVTTGLLVSGATTTGISITGNATDAIKIDTGTFTTGINIGGTTTTAINMAAGVQNIGVTGTRRSMSTAPLFNIWATSALTTGNLQAAKINTFYTGVTASESIEAFASVVTADVATGNWVNAIVGKVDYSTNGSVTGLAGVICAELDMPGSSPATGHYACFEAELNCPASSDMGVATSFMIANAWGDNVAAFQTSGHIFEFTGLGTPTAGKILDECTAAAASHALRILIDGTPYYVLLQSNVDA